MSWTAFIVQLHTMSIDVLDWAAGASSSIGDVHTMPNPQPLLAVDQTLDAIRLAGCHGDSWFTINDDKDIERLPRCPASSNCAEHSGHDLGEVSITVLGDHAEGGPIRPDALVESMSFRKPHGMALLRAAIALSAAGGTQLVFDDSADTIAIVTPTDRLETLAEIWLWA